eukprot:6435898-Pyramimonas_sp.AAC.1
MCIRDSCLCNAACSDVRVRVMHPLGPERAVIHVALREMPRRWVEAEMLREVHVRMPAARGHLL